MAPTQFDAEAQTHTLLQARTFAVSEGDEVPEAPALAARPSKRLVAGLLLAGAGVCALAGAGRWSRWPAGALSPAAPGVEGRLIQDDAWASCDMDWVIKKQVFDNLSGKDMSEPAGMRFEVERHGGGLPVERFLLDVKSPEIHDADRSGHGEAHGSFWKLHLAHGHPLNLHFTLWDMEHKDKLTMENFGIGFYDLDESKKGGHHEFIVAEPSMVARLGADLEVVTEDSGKKKFQATKFGLGEDDPDANKEVSAAQKAKSVRLIYNNVKGFVVGFGWTNPDHGIPREISFSLHDPEHCTDPIAAPSEPVDEDTSAAAAEAAAALDKSAEQLAEELRAEAERDAAKREQRDAEKDAEREQDRAQTAEKKGHIAEKKRNAAQKLREEQQEELDSMETKIHDLATAEPAACEGCE